MDSNMIWLVFFAIAAVLVIIEMFTSDLTAIMIGIGFGTGSVVAFLGGPVWLAVAVTAAVSLLLWFLARPPLKAKLEAGIPEVKMGTDSLVGENGIAISDERVEFKVRGDEIWTCYTVDRAPLEPGASYTAEKVTGSTILVRKAILASEGATE